MTPSSSNTPSPIDGETTIRARDLRALGGTTTSCPVPWCINDDTDRGDHSAGPATDAWPGVVATAYDLDERPHLSPAPTWGQCEGLAPAVVLYIQSSRLNTEWSADFTPAEARQLAAELVRAATVAEATS